MRESRLGTTIFLRDLQMVEGKAAMAWFY